MGYSGAGGKLIHEKNQKQKISWHCPFKGFHLFTLMRIYNGARSCFFHFDADPDPAFQNYATSGNWNKRKHNQIKTDDICFLLFFNLIFEKSLDKAINNSSK